MTFGLPSVFKDYETPALIEEYLGGREFTVAIINSDTEKQIVSAIEIVPPESTDGLRILGSCVKTNNTEQLVAIDKKDLDKLKALALAAFIGLGVRGYGRIDVKMDTYGNCFFLEANLVPGMTKGSSYFPRACEIANEIIYAEVVNMMMDECIARIPVDKNSTEILTRTVS